MHKGGGAWEDGADADRFIDAYFGAGYFARGGGETDGGETDDGEIDDKEADGGEKNDGEIDGSEDLGEYEFPRGGMIIEPVRREKMGKRTRLSLCILLLLVPPLLFLLVALYHGRHYLAISLSIAVLATLPFFISFEGRRPGAREVMVISVLAAIGVAGRAAFYMLPNVKPVAAVTILSGVSLGGEAGFLVGCLIVLASNLFFGQGPWTPWQMFAYGTIGLISGILFQKGILKPRLSHLCLYGFWSVIVIFGGIMNPASILMGYGQITWETLLSYYISGLPMDLVQAASTALFLLLISRQMLWQLERVKRKYGITPS